MTTPIPSGTIKDARALTRQQKAAIVIGVLGPDAAGPLLERLDEASLRGFAEAMSRLKRVEAEVVEEIIGEFLTELDRAGTTLQGGLSIARGMLERHVKEGTLMRILDDVDVPSIHNVWSKLSRVNEAALAEFLRREHPQTAAVVLSKLSSEHAARVLGRFDPDRARDVILGITRTQNLAPEVIEAIGASVSRDFLAGQNADAPVREPADRIGAIMNFAAADTRNSVLDLIAENQPDFAEQIKRKMFTFEDIPDRLEPRDVTPVLRAVEQDVLLRALAGAEQNAPAAREFLMSNISSRMSDQLRAALEDFGTVRRKDAEEAQNGVILAIRELERRGEIRLVSPEGEEA